MLGKQKKRGANRAQKNLIAVKDAVASGRRYIYMDLTRRKGIFKVVGGKRNPRVKMVHDLTKGSVRIPKTPWLAPATQDARKAMPGLYAKALRFQLARRR